ncbi:hypothetical protein M3O96_18210 [Aquiflexum sp. TKW24L]|uniref:hypothetical protein n=1 Tax=Aquiflexum sp. TKW24L TaxID=2942212 RepID=UPI0020BEB761|nr:hypothetical protein [Aquiflexum sp. TKW24L]MCL6261044.1 hypothetical protein [Aquiflexum sp. TKW24L]
MLALEISNLKVFQKNLKQEKKVRFKEIHDYITYFKNSVINGWAFIPNFVMLKHQKTLTCCRGQENGISFKEYFFDYPWLGKIYTLDSKLTERLIGLKK